MAQFELNKMNIGILIAFKIKIHYSKYNYCSDLPPFPFPPGGKAHLVSFPLGGRSGRGSKYN